MNILTKFNYRLRSPEFADKPLKGVVSRVSIAGDNMVLDTVFGRGKSHIDMYRAANGEANATITADRQLPYFALYASSMQEKGIAGLETVTQGFAPGREYVNNDEYLEQISIALAQTSRLLAMLQETSAIGTTETTGQLAGLTEEVRLGSYRFYRFSQ